MGTVTFEEVKDIFDIGTVWTGGREEYWFQFAWSLLEKAQMTRYCNVYEEKTIHLYAVVLVAVYLEFCEITWEEYCEERILLDIEESFSPLEIGQLLKQFLKPGEIITDMEEAINEIVFHLKYRLFHAMVRYVWETLEYTVVGTRIISPDDVDAIKIQPDKDMITLFTCHPYASGGRQRYLVFCERIKNQIRKDDSK